jgi:hypothetical protein
LPTYVSGKKNEFSLSIFYLRGTMHQNSKASIC